MFEFYFETSGSASYWTIRDDISATQYSWAKLLHVQVNLLDGLQKLFLQKDHLRGGCNTPTILWLVWWFSEYPAIYWIEILEDIGIKMPCLMII